MLGSRRGQGGWLSLLLLGGCYTGFDADDPALNPWHPPSDVDPDPDSDNPDIPVEPDDPTTEVDCSVPVAGPPVLLRLTRAEYANTVRDLLGVSGDVALSFVPDGVIDGFSTNAVVPVTPLQVEGYLAASEAIAANALVSNPGLVPCDPALVGEAPCAELFVDTLGPKAFRRPLDPAQRGGLLDVFASGESFADGARLTVTALLQSPEFLYRIERTVPQPDEDTGLLRLDGYTTASRLSYLLWRSMPDDELMDLAAIDGLGTAEALEVQTRRMLEDPRGSAVFADFHRQWLGIESVAAVAKDPDLFPGAPTLLPAMAIETAAFVDQVIRHGDARLETLLTARWSVLDAGLAQHYGVELPVGEQDPMLPLGFFVADLPESERSGLLTHASVLAAHAKPDSTAPILRGVFAREHVLCTELPDPPADVPPEPAIDPDVPVREQFDQHSSDPACNGCHVLIDDLGFAHENYDAMGAYRLIDKGGNAIDASAELAGTDVDGPIDGAVDLAETLAGSRQVQDCMATQWFRYASARPSRAQDVCTLDELRAAFDSTGGDVHELVLSIVLHPSFTHVES